MTIPTPPPTEGISIEDLLAVSDELGRAKIELAVERVMRRRQDGRIAALQRELATQVNESGVVAP